MKDDYITNSHHLTYTFISVESWENVLCELGSERVDARRLNLELRVWLPITSRTLVRFIPRNVFLFSGLSCWLTLSPRECISLTSVRSAFWRFAKRFRVYCMIFSVAHSPNVMWSGQFIQDSNGASIRGWGSFISIQFWQFGMTTWGLINFINEHNFIVHEQGKSCDENARLLPNNMSLVIVAALVFAGECTRAICSLQLQPYCMERFLVHWS